MIKRTPPPTRTPGPPPGFVPLRGPSGRLYGYYDPVGQVIEFKRGGQQAEQIKLGDLPKR